MCHQGPRINWQSVWHKLNAGSLEDQRTSLMSDADDFLNPFSSVCVCVCVFSFSTLGGQMSSPKTLLLLIFKGAWILWQQLNNNNVTKSMKLQNHFKLLHTFQTEMKKKMDLEPFFWGVIFFSIWCEPSFFLNLVSLTFGKKLIQFWRIHQRKAFDTHSICFLTNLGVP
jgi:hypothetical protein